MELSILLPFLIMAAGYSVSECLPLKYRMAMTSGYLQYGAIILYGTLYLTAWAGLYYLALVFPRLLGFDAVLTDLDASVVEHALFVSVTGVVSSSVFRHLFNIRYRDDTRKEYLASSISAEYGDDLDVLLFGTKHRSETVLFVLDSQMVYLGWVVGTPNPLNDKDHQHIRILPAKSGYRNEQREIVFTKHYDVVIESMGEDYEKIMGFVKVIPRKSIVSANVFDIGIYEEYFEQK